MVKNAKDALESDLSNLSKIYAPSRRERESADYLESALKNYVDTSSIDTMNNYVGIKKGKNAKKTILIDAHVDEVTRAAPGAIIPKRDGSIFSGKAMDDRSGCAAMIAVARELSAYDDLNVIYVGAAQEELGTYGAAKVAGDLARAGKKIDLAVALDVIDCYADKKSSNRLGAGISIMQKPAASESASEEDLRALERCYKVAASYGGKYQVSTYNWQGDLQTTDAKQYHDITKAPTLVVSIPCLNMHGYSGEAHGMQATGGTMPEKICMNDLADTVKFTTKLVKSYAKL